MSDKIPVLRDTDDEARALARTLLRGAGSGALAVIEPDTEGFPLASRVLLGMDIDGSPVILVSHLSAHTRALLGDARCMTTRPQAAAHYAVVHCKAPAADWQVVGIDMAGLDLAAGDLRRRMEFGETMADQADLRAMLLKLYQ